MTNFKQFTLNYTLDIKGGSFSPNFAGDRPGLGIGRPDTSPAVINEDITIETDSKPFGSHSFFNHIRNSFDWSSGNWSFDYNKGPGRASAFYHKD